jgi:hypothetical protein
MVEGLYNKSIKCPVCKKDFDVTKVKSNAFRVSARDTDFCVYYEGINPIFYDVWVCENCGYASQSDKFDQIRPEETEVILANVSSRWSRRSFAGERSIDGALDAFKLALYNLQLKNSKQSDVARVCIRIAWLYRMKKDKKEMDFLNFALKCYVDTFDKEEFPIDKLDEYTCMYIIGELHRRIGNIDESIKWFSRLLGSPEARKNQKLVESAREQYHLVKEMEKEHKKGNI